MKFGPVIFCSTIAAAVTAVVVAVAAQKPLERAPSLSPTAALPATIRFDRDVRPILSDRCFKCHGPDAKQRQAELRLDVREVATGPRKDGPAIVPGDAKSSELWRRVSSTDPREMMPPPDSNKRALNADERAIVKKWIDEGAAYEPHWSFVPPQRTAPPASKNMTWVKNPIDSFILARLESEKIEPSPEASKSTLARRVFFDLTGLPPTPEELDTFLADARPDAYEKLVDTLLTAEPYVTRHAERMAAPWMDQSRYADTCGIHMDAGRQMWLWRDWVLNAYRTNMPFDQFLTEQLAGDLIEGASESQKIATGFNRCHVTTDEAGAIDDEYLVEYAVDRTATTGSVFLGLTVGCARCHDHKFDPVTTEDFYSLLSFFNSIEEPGLYSQTQNIQRAHEPFILVPTDEQKDSLAALAAETAALKAKQEERTPQEQAQRDAFMTDLTSRAGVVLANSKPTAASSPNGSTLEVRPDDSFVATGENPAKDRYEITLHTDATGLRLLLLEAIPEASAPQGRLGRSNNGNAVMTGLTIRAVSSTDPAQTQTVTPIWAWADFAQDDGDFGVVNILGNDPARGWALGGHKEAGERVALLLMQEPFGFAGGTDLHVTLYFESLYDRHNLARGRLSVGMIGEAGLPMLPAASSHWYVVGPFQAGGKDHLFDVAYGPEEADGLDLKRTFDEKKMPWRFDMSLADDKPVALPEGRNTTYVGRFIYCSTARELPVSLGSDDGFRLFVNGMQVAARNVERGVAPDQDKAVIPLKAGRNAVVMKIVNTGGVAGYYYHAAESAELPGDLVGGLVPEKVRSDALAKRLELAWHMTYLPGYKERAAQIAAKEKRTAEINAAVPRTMVMKELAARRPTFVLSRGQYDHPDKQRPVERRVPASLGKLPEGAPANRLGLARWLTSAENPLTARVAVNRMWELAFGTGLVRTSEDFGHQGEWPSHPELLDWLAVEFRESGWDMRHIIRLIVTSETYRQSSRVRPELKERDADNRLLACYSRRRLTAEQTRDQALYISGLLVEKLGGPSVKPYQPEGLWQEVAMPTSNTRVYTRGMGTDLWRRSLYTYWKRACPPPSMQAFDAPTREMCTIRRAVTDTPLQALVLWNDEQFVEAARMLAQRTLAAPGDDAARLRSIFRRSVSRDPQPQELASLAGALASFRDRYKASPQDAADLIGRGVSAASKDLDPSELAAWTMIATAVMSLYEATTQE